MTVGRVPVSAIGPWCAGCATCERTSVNEYRDACAAEVSRGTRGGAKAGRRDGGVSAWRSKKPAEAAGFLSDGLVGRE